ncbi:hypothetical protein SynA1825c_02375 [Synechococcus sp. A18-25c]|nr:hypothetical protein SynA1825c_02375 [Synechococcus sp. A18-25c]
MSATGKRSQQGQRLENGSGGLGEFRTMLKKLAMGKINIVSFD